MKSKVFVLMTFVCLAAACGKKDENKSEQQGSVGPFELKVSDEAKTTANEFDVPINQENGKVEFHITPTARQKLQLTQSVTAGVNCSSNVKVTHLWVTDNKVVKVVNIGDPFFATPQVKNVLLVAFENLKGCSHLHFTMVVKQLPTVNVPSTFDTIPDQSLVGSWEYKDTSGLRILWVIDTSGKMGWVESKAGNYVCNKSFSLKSASTQAPRLFYAPENQVACSYDLLDDGQKKKMRVTCDTDAFGCTLPANFVFVRD